MKTFVTLFIVGKYPLCETLGQSGVQSNHSNKHTDVVSLCLNTCNQPGVCWGEINSPSKGEREGGRVGSH